MVGLSGMQDVVVLMLGVSDGARPSFVARFRHLHAMGFPPMGPGQRGKRFDYRADELLATALVFELQQAFVPPAIGVDIVVARWPELLRGLDPIVRGETGGEEVVRISPFRLTGPADLNGEREEFEVAFRSNEGGQIFEGSRDSRAPRGLIALNGRDICGSLLSSLRTVDPAAAEAFGGGLANTMSEGTTDGGVRLSERDFYWQRAAALFGDDGLHRAVGEGREWLPSETGRRLAGYLLDPLPREACRSGEIVPGAGGVAFVDSLAALLGIISEIDGGRTGVAHSVPLRRFGGTAAELCKVLATYARRRAVEVGVEQPSAAIATRRRNAGRVRA